MTARSDMVFNIFTAISLILGVPAVAQTSMPADFTIEGRLYDNSSGVPLNQSVGILLELVDESNPTCVLYREEFLNQNLASTTTPGGFAVQMGKGTKLFPTGTVNFSTLFSPNQVLPGINSSTAVGSEGSPTACTPGTTVTTAAGSHRRIRVSVNAGSSWDYMAPDTIMTATPTAFVADTAFSLDGKTKSDFLLTNTNVANSSLNQTNLETVFTNTNYTQLLALLNGSATSFISSNPTAAVSFNGQRLTSVANPTAATDAATKGYTDANLGGQAVDMTGIAPGMGQGKVLTWDQTLSKWVAGTPNAGVTFLQPGNGLINGGPITTTGTLSVDTGIIANKIVQLDGTARLPAVDGSQLTNLNAIQKLTGDVSAIGQGSVAATIQPNAVTSAKINNLGIASNQLLITDASGGATVTYKTCALNEILQWTGLGWACETIPFALGNVGVAGTYGNSTQVAQATVDATGRVTQLTNVNINFPVTSVNGHTGPVTLLPADLGLGTAALQDVGVAAGNVVQLAAGGKLPAVDGSNLTTVNASSLQGKPVASGTPSGSQVLTWNGTLNVWDAEPVAASIWQLNGGKAYYNAGWVGVGTNNPVSPLDVSTTLNASSGTDYGLHLLDAINASGTEGYTGIYLNATPVATGSGVYQLMDLEWNSSSKFSVDVQGRTLANAFYTTGGSATSAAVGPSTSTAGLWFPGNNAVGFLSNGNEQMRLTAAGNLGIGMTLPGAALHIKAGTLALPPLMLTSGTLTSSPQAGAIEYDGANLYYTDNTNVRHSLSGGGGSATSVNANSTGPNTPSIEFSDDPATGFYSSSAGTIGISSAGASVATIDGLSMNLTQSTTSISPATGALVINSGGLGVGGSIYAGSGITSVGSSANSYLLNAGTSPVPSVSGSNATIAVVNTSSTNNSGAYYNMTATNGSGNSQSAYIGAVSSAGGSNTPSIVFGAQTGLSTHTERMRLDQNGRVGIGTTTPAGLLDVMGAIFVDNTPALNLNSASQSVAVGDGQLGASQNTAVGINTLSNNTSGSGNTAVGASALANAGSAQQNTAIGVQALQSATNSATLNSALGYQAAKTLTSGSQNTLLGASSGININTGNSNTVIGAFVAPNLVSGSSNIIIGANASVDVPTPGTTNFLNIGNTIFAGGMTGTVSSPAGFVGIDAFDPTSTLDLNGAVTVRGMAAPGTAPANQGRIYFDPGSQHFMVSENNGAFQQLLPAPANYVQTNGTSTMTGNLVFNGTGEIDGGTNPNNSLTLNSTTTFPKGNIILGTSSSSGQVLIGETNAMNPLQSGLEVNFSPNATSGTYEGSNVVTTINSAGASFMANGAMNDVEYNAGGSSGTINGATNSARVNGGGSLGGVTGTNSMAVVNSFGGTTSSANGVYSQVSNLGSSSILSAYGVQSFVSNTGSGGINNAYGGYFSLSGTTNSIFNGYGVYAGTISGALNKWSFYASDATAPSYFAAGVGIGTTTPRGMLEVSATGTGQSALYQNVYGGQTFHVLANFYAPIDLQQQWGWGAVNGVIAPNNNPNFVTNTGATGVHGMVDLTQANSNVQNVSGITSDMTVPTGLNLFGASLTSMNANFSNSGNIQQGVGLNVDFENTGSFAAAQINGNVTGSQVQVNNSTSTGNSANINGLVTGQSVSVVNNGGFSGSVAIGTTSGVVGQDVKVYNNSQGAPATMHNVTGLNVEIGSNNNSSAQFLSNAQLTGISVSYPNMNFANMPSATAYGLQIGPMPQQAQFKYAIYAPDSASNTYLGGNVGIGTPTPNYALDVQSTNSMGPTSNWIGSNLVVNSTYPSTVSLVGSSTVIKASSAMTSANLVGSSVQLQPSVSVGSGVGFQSTLTGNFSNFAYGFFSNNTATTANRYDFYAGSASAYNYFAGNVGVGVTNPVNKLEVAGPVKLGTSGTAVNSMGVCTTSSLALGQTPTTLTCTGLPNSTAIAINCSANGLLSSPSSNGVYCRAAGITSQMSCNTIGSNTNSISLTCMWAM